MPYNVRAVLTDCVKALCYIVAGEGVLKHISVSWRNGWWRKGWMTGEGEGEGEEI